MIIGLPDILFNRQTYIDKISLYMYMFYLWHKSMILERAFQYLKLTIFFKKNPLK